MYLNDHPQQEEAGGGLKALLLVFVIVLLGGLGYLVWYETTLPIDPGGDIIVSPDNL